MARYYEDGAGEAAKLMNLLLQQGGQIKNFETRLLGHDGRRVYASLSASLLYDRTGKTIGTLGVSKDITPRVELEHKLKELTITDGLTGLYNQRYFYRKVITEMERARRQKRDLAFMLFDLDRFKAYNDTFGHLEGDKLLKEVGRLLRDSIRNMVDSAFRYGGDEFVVLLPELEGSGRLPSSHASSATSSRPASEGWSRSRSGWWRSVRSTPRRSTSAWRTRPCTSRRRTTRAASSGR